MQKPTVLRLSGLGHFNWVTRQFTSYVQTLRRRSSNHYEAELSPKQGQVSQSLSHGAQCNLVNQTADGRLLCIAEQILPSRSDAPRENWGR